MHNVLFPLTYLGLEPFMIVLARALQSEAGFNPTYLAVTPAEAMFARNNLQEDSLVVELGRKVRGVEREDVCGTPVSTIYGFMKAKYGGADRVWRRRVNKLFETVERVIQARQITAIVIWNGNDCLGQICKILANKYGLKMVYLENGYFPNTLQIDPQGVNAQASVREVPCALWASRAKKDCSENDGPVHPSEIVPLHFLQRLKLKCRAIFEPGYFDCYPELLDQRFKKEVKTTLKLSTGHEVRKSHKNFALVVLQVHDDTQILLNSRLFKTPKEFLEHCYETIRHVYGNDYQIVIKLHPADIGRICYSALALTFEGVSWIGAEPVEPLLKACDFVMVINSSVGLQSIAAGKPTLVFGESFYSRGEICHVVKSKDQTCRMLREVQVNSKGMNLMHANNFISFLSRQLFVNGSWNIKPESDLAPAVHRINFLLRS